MPTISFLILTFNSAHYITPLLDSIFSKIGESIENGTYEVVIVDNASIDDTQNIIKNYFKTKEGLFDVISEDKEFHKNVRLFEGKENLGYAKGINLAAKFARGNFLAVLNPDAQLKDEDFGKVLESFSNNSKLAIAGLSIVDYEERREQTVGKFFNPVTFFFYAVGMEKLLSLRLAPKGPQRVDYVSGGFTIFKKELFEKLNGFDEDYFMYIEDMDICFRAKKLGMEVWYLPYATLRHKGQGSSSREFAIVNIYKGLVLFYKKHKNRAEQIYTKSLLSLKATFIIFMSLILGKKEPRNTYSKALQAIS